MGAEWLPPTSSFLHPKKVKERRPESVKMAKLYTPLGNQERMLKKRHQEPTRKKKVEKNISVKSDWISLGWD